MAFVTAISTMRNSNSSGSPRLLGKHHHKVVQENNQQQQHHHHHQRGFKGLLSRSNVRSSSSSSSTQPQSSGGSVSSSYAAHPELHTAAQEVADDFLPNPKIPDSPGGTPPRKKWEGAYRNFLGRGSKSGSPNTVSSDVSSKSPESSSAASSKQKGVSSFSLLPGTKRLVTRTSNSSSSNNNGHHPSTPQSVPDTHRSVIQPSELSGRSVPSLPNLKAAAAENSNGGDDSAIRGGKFFKAVFSRTRSDKSFSSTNTPPTNDNNNTKDELDMRRSKSCNGDELDAVMRRGEEKGSYSPSSVHSRIQSKSSMATFVSLEEATEDDDDGGLDSLLASASSSPNLAGFGNLNGMSRCSSTGMIHHPVMIPGSTLLPPQNSTTSSGGYALPRRTPSANDVAAAAAANGGIGGVVDRLPNPQQVTQPTMPSLPEPQSFRSAAMPPPQPQGSLLSQQFYSYNEMTVPPQQQQQQPQGGLGSLLSQQVPNYDELDVRHHHHQETQPQQHYSAHPPPPSHPVGSMEFGVGSHPVGSMEYGVGYSIGAPPPPSTDYFFQNPAAYPSPSSNSFQEQQQSYFPYHPHNNMMGGPNNQHHNPAMLKKAFTNFHNGSRFGDDATSAFLGDEASLSMRHDSYVSYQMMMMRGGGSSVPYHETLSERSVVQQVNVSTSLPLETVDENNISIHKGMRLLKPMQGTDAWESGRRYLIAPAAMAACPLMVVNKLSGELVQTASEASSSQQGFGTIDLGECLITYVGEKHHLSLGKWSKCRLVLRQNYLLEYDCAASKTSLPRGFCHLQHAVATKHADFADSFELNFYASPCAKADQRVLMVRVLNRDERDDWITCLNRAARLELTDLWDFDPSQEIGQGRYASVYPAKRRSCGQAARSYPSLHECECALKVVDKNQFWRRVVKGRERADTLVREPSVQSTLTAKCGKVPSFLQLRGFFETSDNVVMELELLKGTDLFEHISDNGVLDETEAAEIISDILTSLEAMNRVGLAHRDVKPANVLMCDKPKDGVCVKLGDFGMATFVGVDGLVRGRCGTPGYVAPEILTAGSRVGYGNRVDVFSAGVTLYVMLCGYEPFYGETEKELIEANKSAVIDFSGTEWNNVSQEAKDLVLKMTSSDPRERPSAKEALEHAWIQQHVEQPDTKTLDQSLSASSSSRIGKNMALSAADAPGEGACVIS